MRKRGNHLRIHIGNIINNAVVFNFKNWHKLNMNTNNITQTVDRLFALLKERQIDYTLVGGIALLYYVKGRNSEDIDLIMSLISLKKLPEIKVIRQEPYFVRGKFDDLKVEIFLAKNPIFNTVKRKYSMRQSSVKQEINYATIEGLILLKLYALPSLYRQSSFARLSLYENDITMLMYDYKPHLEPLLKELKPYLNDTEFDFIREEIYEIQRRIERFSKKNSF